MSRSDEVVYQQDDDWNMFPSYFIVCFFSLPSSTAHSCDQLKYPFIFKSSPPNFKSYVSLHKSANSFSPLLTSEPVTDDHRTQKRQQQFAMLCVSL